MSYGKTYEPLDPYGTLGQTFTPPPPPNIRPYSAVEEARPWQPYLNDIGGPHHYTEEQPRQPNLMRRIGLRLLLLGAMFVAAFVFAYLEDDSHPTAGD
jgi:hypothetical protein